MQIYLIRHGEIDPASAIDPYCATLSAHGHIQSRRLAELCRDWEMQFLCASTMRRAQETADAISDLAPDMQRWDLDELEDLTLDDLHDNPFAPQFVSSWSSDQVRQARENAWNRVIAAITRIQLYASKNAIERIAIVGHHSTTTLLLVNFLGGDWRAVDALDIAMATGSTSKVTVDGGLTRIEWLNRTHADGRLGT